VRLDVRVFVFGFVAQLLRLAAGCSVVVSIKLEKVALDLSLVLLAFSLRHVFSFRFAASHTRRAAAIPSSHSSWIIRQLWTRLLAIERLSDCFFEG
jgi:hypothetical protein